MDQGLAPIKKKKVLTDIVHHQEGRVKEEEEVIKPLEEKKPLAVERKKKEEVIKPKKEKKPERERKTKEKANFKPLEQEPAESEEEEDEPLKEEEEEEEEEIFEPINLPVINRPSDSVASKLLMRAVYRGKVRKVKELLKEGIDPEQVADQHGWTGLHWAASQRDSEMVDLFLPYTKLINARELTNGWSPLHLAAISKSLCVVKQLLNAKADVALLDFHGDTAVDCTDREKIRQAIETKIQ